MAKGKDDKFDLKVTTGRNLPEMNFYFKKIKEQGLKIPMPASVTISNGGDEFFKKKDIDYFSSSDKDAFLKTDFSKEKREWVKKHSGGWDGVEIRSLLKNLFQTTINDPNKNKNIAKLADFIGDSETSEIKSYPELEKAYDHMIQSNMNKEQLRQHIEKLSEKTIKSSKNPDETKWLIGELAHQINEIKSGKNSFKIFDAQTTQSSIFYDNDMTLQGQLKRTNLIPSNYVGFRDDGNLGFHLALSHDSNPNENDFKHAIGNLLSEKGISYFIKSREEDGDSRDMLGGKLPTIKLIPKVKGEDLDKVHGIKLQVDEIIKNNTNDLIIAAGDGSNDAKMLNLFNYIEEKGLKEDFNNIEKLKKVYALPLISIFVDNGEDVSDGGISFDKIDKYFNSDGNVRFIHVNPKDPKKPQNLIEATQLAIREYAKRNAEFAKNLSEEMKDKLSKMTYEYPIDKEFIKELEKKNGITLYNPATNIDFNKLKNAANDIKQESKTAKKNKIVLIIASILGAGGILAGLLIPKKEHSQKT